MVQKKKMPTSNCCHNIDSYNINIYNNWCKSFTHEEDVIH
ncbi:hypothetical protein A3Q56_00941 [Intoshia linei]|uniref:Uncharacterized protein n=1 Tax=Intoshia linei TaxID=1819745 RepID=A0A177BAF4_9BILA|nr:hypothetical protein A3Q56_00941 [Intoshia linei]